ncbi:Uncharacterised protein [Mycobacteroides abscessus subsp. abscessus]|nr:Uncharacterised protein [Mycobacteroides abscessus subsp. abscessus]
MTCAREMRGIASTAYASTPASFSAPTLVSALRGAKKPISFWPRRSLAISASLGGDTRSTTSAAYGSPIVAPASTYASSGINASTPAPDSTVTGTPLPTSVATTFGTSATRRSPSAVSRTTPTLMLSVSSLSSSALVFVSARSVWVRAHGDPRVYSSGHCVWRLVGARSSMRWSSARRARSKFGATNIA